MAHLEPTMFREYDLRGLVNDRQLNKDSMYVIGKAYAVMLHARNIKSAVLGYDFRSYSEKLANSFQKALLSSGIDVINLGMVSTPMMYASQYYFQTEGGVMITASHNPNGWSGVKLALGLSHTLVPSEMRELYQLTISEHFINGQGKLTNVNCFPKYLSDLKSRVSVRSGLKVVVNTANSGMGIYVPRILSDLGIETIGLHTRLDWDFPHYNPNPSSLEMMEDTARNVLVHKANLGVAIDADGDRLGLTDEKGNIIWPDRWLTLLERLMLSKYPGSKIVFDVKCSQALEEDIKAHAGIPLMEKTGHSYIKERLQKEKAILGGEFSGHVFFNQPEYYGFDDAVFALLKILEYLTNSHKTLSQHLADTPYYISSPTYQVSCQDLVKYEIVEKLTKEFKKEGFEVLDISGARVKFPDGWGLVRASSNLPVLVLRFEAKTKERLEEIMSIFKEKLAKFKEVGSIWESG